MGLPGARTSPTRMIALFGLLISLNSIATIHAQGYYGVRLGPLSQFHHGVSGEIFAVDARTIFIKDFNYDGEGPAAYFYVGTSPRPNNNGATRLRDERGSAGVLRRYRHKDITLSMPEGKTLRDFKWFSVWCDDFSVNFGDITIPKNVDFPRPQKIGALKGVHEVSSENIVIVDAQTLLIPNFSYDGEAPDAKFWVGRGQKPSPQGVRIPDENGKEEPLRRYDKKTIVLTLPGDLTVFDIGHFGIWCEAFTVDFGHVRIPAGMVVPPSLKMLGVSPQSKLNCEVLYDDLAFEVRWAVAGESIVVQLVAKLDGNEYMSFGLSSDLERSVMVGGDVAVVWVDKYTGKGYAHDYYLDDKSQCSGTRGSCPDLRIQENTNSIRLLNAAMVNGYSIVTYQRPLKAADALDVPIYTNQTQAIIWALGPLNQRNEVSFHSQYTRGDRLIDFGRQPVWNCPMPETDKNLSEDEDYDEEFYEEKQPQNDRKPVQPVVPTPPSRPPAAPQRQPPRQTPPSQPATTVAPKRPARPAATPKPASKKGAWFIPPIQCNEPEDGVFYAQMGPTGGKQGYPAITGHVGWGISWYINGLLIPEINVVRGKEYTFVVEGGFDPEIPAKYHPFYITDDSVGGYIHKTDAEKANIQVFAGLHRSRNGVETPTGIGRLCNWTPNPDGPSADEFTSFGAYQRTLSLKCDEGNPGVITWTPDANTPDTVYYQCFTHRYLGWRINVLDSCEDAQASEVEAVYAEADTSAEGIDAEPSIRHETKVRAQNHFDPPNSSAHLKNHNMDEVPPKLQFQLGGKKELNKLLNAGILAAEILEEEVNGNRTALDEESMNEGERMPGDKQPSYLADIKVPTVHGARPNPDTGILFLKHPKNGQYLRPAQGPIRRYPTFMVEKRPMHSIKRPPRPFVIPQPAPLMNHYKPHAAPLMTRPSQNNGPPLKPVLVLGQPTEIRTQAHPPQYMGNHGRQPFPDHIPQGYIKRPDRPYNSMLTAASTPVQKKVPLEGNSGKGPKEPAVKFAGPIHSHEVVPKSTIKPAENTGFHPQTVIVESGFRPITNRKPGDRRPERKTEQRRRADIITEIDEAIEGDALLINNHRNVPIRSFEPMFIPSPRDEMAGVAPALEKVETVQQQQKQLQMQQKLQHMQEHHMHDGEIKHEGDEEEEDHDEGDDDDDEENDQPEGEMETDEESPNYPKIMNREASNDGAANEMPSNMNFESGEDKMVEAASRMDAYYLPPENKVMKKKMEMSDMTIPVGAVVTYDGKAVLDTSLINSAPPDDINELVQPGLTTKTEQLRNTPQFGPFKGEMPPLTLSAFVPNNLPQLKPDTKYKGTGPVTEYSNPLTTSHTTVGNSKNGAISTKLTLLKTSERKRREVHREEYPPKSGCDKLLPSAFILVIGLVGVFHRI